MLPENLRIALLIMTSIISVFQRPWNHWHGLHVDLVAHSNSSHVWGWHGNRVQYEVHIGGVLNNLMSLLLHRRTVMIYNFNTRVYHSRSIYDCHQHRLNRIDRLLTTISRNINKVFCMYSYFL